MRVVIAVVSVVLVIGIILGLFLFSPAMKIKSAAAKAERLAKQGRLDEAVALCQNVFSSHKNSPHLDRILFLLGRLYLDKGELLEAKKTLLALLKEYPSSADLSKALAKLGEVNMRILFSPIATDVDLQYEVAPGDNLNKIAAKYNLDSELLKECNQLKSAVIHPGNKIKIPQARFSILVDKSQNTLILKANEEFFKAYTVATGRDNSTPTGVFKIVNKLENPTWFKAGKVIPAGNGENILGSRWLGLSVRGYGIHGTTDPASLGKQVTDGCVRMSNSDVEELYKIVALNCEVTIVD